MNAPAANVLIQVCVECLVFIPKNEESEPCGNCGNKRRLYVFATEETASIIYGGNNS